MDTKLAEIVDEWFEPKEAREYQDSYTLTNEQKRVIQPILSSFNGISGVTIKKQRFLTDGAILLCCAAISLSDAWEEGFKPIFKALGNNWCLSAYRFLDGEPLHYENTATKGPEGEPKTGINLDSWQEDLDPLEYLAVDVKGISLFKNSTGKTIGINTRYVDFTGDWNLSLGDTKESNDPIPLTHCDSAGFAGFLMPIDISDKDRRKELADVLLTAIKALRT